jgi:enoyl-CoA hydratase/carnithine racemase
MGLTGDKIKGKDLAKCGVATNFVSNDKLDKLKEAIIEKSKEDVNLQQIQELVNEYSEIVYSPNDFGFPKSDEISRTFIPDDLNEVFVRLQRLAENGSEAEMAWATKTINSLNSFSPLSLVVTFEQIKRGIKIKTLEEAYNIEAQMVSA